jgi:hypothetical protein
MKFIHDFMQSLKKKNRQGAGGAGGAIVSLSLLPKENVIEFKRSRCKITEYFIAMCSVCESAIIICNALTVDNNE